MKAYAIAPIVMASITLTVGVNEILIWARRRKGIGSLSFSFTCFGFVLYCIACAGLYNVSNPLESLPWLRAQAAVFSLMGLCFLWFISNSTGTFPKSWLGVFAVVYCLGAAVQVLGLGRLTWIADQPFIKDARLPFGFRVQVMELVSGPITDAVQASGFIALVVAVRSIMAYARSGHRRDARVLALGTGILVVAFTTDFLVGFGIIHIPYTLEYAWLAFIFAMGLERSRQFREGDAAKSDLAASEARFRTIVEESFDIIIICDEEGKALFLSPSFGRVLGYSPEAFLGRSLLDLVHTEEREAAALSLSLPAFSGTRSISCFRVRKADGTWAFIEMLATDLGSIPSIGGFLVIGRDITKWKRGQEATLASLREKELLIKEIHHRVKNNLQVISSLLSLHARKSEDRGIKTVVEECRSQIYAMAVVHEELYSQPDFEDIDFGSCARRLAEHLLVSSGKAGQVALSARIDEVRLGIDAAIPCALILNELISNALRRGFSAPTPGAELQIELKKGEDGRVTLSVADNGDFPETEAQPGPEAFQIVSVLAKQLQGTMTLDRGEPSLVRIEFPL